MSGDTVLLYGLIVLFWAIFHVSKYTKLVLDSLLFKADDLGLSLVLWAYYSSGIICFIYYFTKT